MIMAAIMEILLDPRSLALLNISVLALLLKFLTYL